MVQAAESLLNPLLQDDVLDKGYVRNRLLSTKLSWYWWNFVCRSFIFQYMLRTALHKTRRRSGDIKGHVTTRVHRTLKIYSLSRPRGFGLRGCRVSKMSKGGHWWWVSDNPQTFLFHPYWSSVVSAAGFTRDNIRKNVRQVLHHGVELMELEYQPS